jgi:DMSO/TMAO reductase YedYZ molybdopterin-dependent catalytic subunit
VRTDQDQVARVFVLSVALVVVSVVQARGQDVQPGPGGASGPVLLVRGEVRERLRISPADLQAMPRKTVRARDRDGKEASFEGVALAELLGRAGAPQGEKLRGEALRVYVLVEAADGYRAVFALPELDPAFTDRVVLLADRRDGQPLDPKDGPFRVVVPDEKRHARWVRQVTALTVQKAPAP